MCTPACLRFGELYITENMVKDRSVIEVGALNVNGSLRKYVESLKPAEYIGVDIVPGPGVDRICAGENLIKTFGKNRFDVVICTEVIEHVQDWGRVIHNLKQIVKPLGVLVITTRSKGVVYHEYPYDFWRYELSDIKRILSDFDIKNIETDILPGVLVLAQKPRDFFEKKTRGLYLYSMALERRSSIRHALVIFWVRRYMKKAKLDRALYYAAHPSEIVTMIKQKSDLMRLSLLPSAKIQAGKDEESFFLSVTFEVAHCNLRCAMCPRGSLSALSNTRTGLMDFELFKRIVDKFIDEKAVVKFVEFGNWGESLLNPELPRMIQYIKSASGFLRKGGVVLVNTNLTVLPDPVALLRSGVDNIRISLSGMSQEVYGRNHIGGNAEKVIRNIRMLSGIKKSEALDNVELAIVFHDYIYNKKDAEEARAFCAEEGIHFVPIAPYVPSVEDAIKFHEDKEKFLEYYGGFIDLESEMSIMRTMPEKDIKNCNLLKNKVAVNFDGQLYRCHLAYEDKHFLGSIFDYKIRDIPDIQAPICIKCAGIPVAFRHA